MSFLEYAKLDSPLEIKPIQYERNMSNVESEPQRFILNKHSTNFFRKIGEAFIITGIFSLSRRFILSKFGIRVYGIGRNLALDAVPFNIMTYFHIYNLKNQLKNDENLVISSHDSDNVDNLNEFEFFSRLDEEKSKFKEKFYTNSQYWH